MVNHFVLKGVMEVQPGTSTLPTLSAKCWASPALQPSQGTAALMAVALKEFLLHWAASIALAVRRISLTVHIIKQSQATVELMALPIQTKMILLEFNAQVNIWEKKLFLWDASEKKSWYRCLKQTTLIKDLKIFIWIWENNGGGALKLKKRASVFFSSSE